MSKLIAALAATAVCLSAFSISMAEPAGASAYQGSSSRACHVGNNAYFGEKADKVRLKERSGLPWCVMGRDGSQFITKGPVVKAMQTLLYCHVDDFHQRDIDGDFGPKTEWAVKKFQWATGLDPDGIVGGGTLDQLFKMKIKRVGNELELAGGTDCGWGNVKVRVRLIERNPNQDGWQLGWVRGLQ